jgi:hypothetical protein
MWSCSIQLGIELSIHDKILGLLDGIRIMDKHKQIN